MRSDPIGTSASTSGLKGPVAETTKRSWYCPSEQLPRRLKRVVVALGMLMVAHSVLLQISIVRGRSMQPVLRDGDRLVVDRLGAEALGVGRFDVVVLQSPTEEGVDYVKRVVGLPGDEVMIRHGRVFVNGSMVEEHHGLIRDGTHAGPLIVPERHCFVLGDNRPQSCDSREFGVVPLATIRGTVRARVWPLDRVSLF